MINEGGTSLRTGPTGKFAVGSEGRRSCVRFVDNA
ncbi:hypothetical protein SZN_11308 [Streptomyces zinciresistens K42]|uniref:Uncharacterized protein n=2 Tax=Streptomyces TaxID=1883 RepID=G2G9U1_9ACTN|nr:hypothetical protein SZN_11308 [Streptomyces zinciresistens K42]